MTPTSQFDGDPMVEPATLPTPTLLDNASDYGDFGSDVEELEILDSLLAQVDAKHHHEEAPLLLIADIEDYEQPRGLLLPKDNAYDHPPQNLFHSESQTLRDYVQIEIGDATRRRSEPEPIPPPDSKPDARSPLERFRTRPKKALSVTDLASPAWCELQYFYTLSKHGRKRKTPAMKQGSAIHKALEDEVHTTVPIQTTKVEDGFGLRLWNICQGLTSLRETGRTREFEIWGTVGGQVVNGIIDELSYECPDPKFEADSKAKGAPVRDMPEYQSSITEYLLADPEKQESQRTKPATEKDEKWIYMADVKTRATPTLPTGSSMRPTIVQLHLYHHMLENLAQGNLDLQVLADRYQLDVNETFSDSFLAQILELNQQHFSDSSQDFSDDQLLNGTTASSQSSLDTILEHNTISSLWQYMMSQFRLTFLHSEPRSKAPLVEASVPPASQQSTSDLPPPPSQPTRLSPLLTVTYLAANYKHSPTSDKQPALLGRKSFQFDSAFLHSYLTESLSWWQGQREAKGVALQEAWKCRNCDFRNDCSWIHERDQAAFDEAMRRKTMREVAGVEGKDVEQTNEISRSTV